MHMTVGKFVSDREIANLFMRDDQRMCDYGMWHWLLAAAYYDNFKQNYQGKIRIIKRGQYPTTYENLSKTFKRSKNTVRRFLKSAEKVGLVELTTDMGHLVITICNYNEIQSFKLKADMPDDTEPDMKADISSDTIRTNKTKKTKKRQDKSAFVSEEKADLPDWKKALQERLEPHVYKTWIKPLSYQDGFLLCPSRGVLNHCNNKLKSEIDAAFKEVGLNSPQLSLKKP